MKSAAWPAFQALHARAADGPVSLRWGLLVLAAAMQLGLFWWLLVHDLQQALSLADQARQRDETSLTARSAALARGQSMALENQLQKDRLSALEEALPGVADGASVWAGVHEASRRHQLRMALFKPGPVGSEAPYPEQRAQLRLIGSFSDLLAFSQTLAGGPSRIALDGFSLSADSSNSGSVVLEATLLSLKRPLASRPLTPSIPSEVGAPLPKSVPATQASIQASLVTLQPAGGGGPPDPFDKQRLAITASAASAALASAVPPSALQAAALSTMRMVGSVRAGDRLAALVMINGVLHAVRVGDAVGNSGGHVVQIQMEALTVREPAAPRTGQAARLVTLSLAKD